MKRCNGSFRRERWHNEKETEKDKNRKIRYEQKDEET